MRAPGRLLLALGLALALAPSPSLRGQGPSPTAEAAAATLQKRYAGVRDFSTDFVHSYAGGVLRKQLTEKGHLLIKKPGRMRWDYTAPEPKQFVSDGVKLYSYLPADKQVLVSTVPPDGDASTPAMFLAGKGDVVRDFTPSLVEVPDGMAPGSLALKLVPRATQREYEWLIVVLDPQSCRLRGLVTVDGQGGRSTFVFTNLQENVGTADTQFAFKMPPGVDVVTDVPRR